MIAVDTNILVYAHRTESPFHAAAATRLRGLAEGKGAWAIPWPCLHEFFAKVTHPAIFTPPTPAATALQFIRELRRSPELVLLAEDDGCFDRLAELVRVGRITGPRIHDARIAALCVEGGVSELWSADRDFGRFPALTTTNPLLD